MSKKQTLDKMNKIYMDIRSYLDSDTFPYVQDAESLESMESFQMESNNHEKHAEPSFLKDVGLCKWNYRKMVKGFVGLLLLSLLSFTIFTMVMGPPDDGLLSKLLDYQLPKEALKNMLNQRQAPVEISSPHSVPQKTRDKLLGGLLLDGLQESSCLSRYQSNMYRRTEQRLPSPDLISRLRRYEALHKRCGPNTDSYNKTLEILKSSTHNTDSSPCKYAIWTPFEGLGNRMLSLASTFLYSLLTNRVLLIGNADDLSDIFCEPFPEVSWFLSYDFPNAPLKDLNPSSPHSYANLVRSNSIGNSSVPPFLLIHMVFDYQRTVKVPFGDQDQTFLQNVPWLIFKSNVYFVPALFSVPSFQEELNKLFPQKDAAFHHLGRYLFHPTNSVWGLVTRYYGAYLAKADMILGLQIRIFYGGDHGPLKHFQDQILACIMRENLLPQINKTEPIIQKSDTKNTTAVLITSLMSGYYEQMRSMYWQYATTTGEMVAFYQPSHEEHQRTGNGMHDRKALAEMYLLSLSDKIVTSAQSTFGYVAQSLGGLQPWILHMADHRKPPNPPCRHSSTMEPCFLFGPAVYSCTNEKGIETATLLPQLGGCEDISLGLKLFQK